MLFVEHEPFGKPIPRDHAPMIIAGNFISQHGETGLVVAMAPPAGHVYSHETMLLAVPRGFGGSPMDNWISKTIRPKIRSLLRRETTEKLWIKCPETGQLVVARHVEANQS